jgi:hypothetical protein
MTPMSGSAVAEGGEFAGGAGSEFADADGGLALEQCEREREAELVVVACRAGHDGQLRGEERVQDVFGGGFAGRAGDGDDARP